MSWRSCFCWGIWLWWRASILQQDSWWGGGPVNISWRCSMHYCTTKGSATISSHHNWFDKFAFYLGCKAIEIETTCTWIKTARAEGSREEEWVIGAANTGNQRQFPLLLMKLRVVTHAWMASLLQHIGKNWPETKLPSLNQTTLTNHCYHQQKWIPTINNPIQSTVLRRYSSNLSSLVGWRGLWQRGRKKGSFLHNLQVPRPPKKQFLAPEVVSAINFWRDTTLAPKVILLIVWILHCCSLWEINWSQSKLFMWWVTKNKIFCLQLDFIH